MKQPNSAISLGSRISERLAAHGVDTVFGIPGVHNLELYRGIKQAGIRHILARHEQGAGFMADGYARATGRPGVAQVISGPGVCNIMTPMGQAYSDSVPMLVLSSCLEDDQSLTGQLHQMRDQRAAAATVCEWSYEARSADAAYSLIDRAMTEFASTRARPRHLQIPIPLLESPSTPAPAPTQAPAPHKADADCVDHLGVEHLAQAILEAKRPIFILGGGAVPSAQAWCEFVTDLGAASFTTFAGRGIMGREAVRDFGTHLARGESAQVLASADLVVVVGAELNPEETWRDTLGHEALLARIDIDPSQMNMWVQPDIAVLGDAGAVVAALQARSLPAKSSAWEVRDVADARVRWRREAALERPGIRGLCDALAAVLPDETMYYSDMTQFAYVALEVWDMPQAGHWHHPSGFGTLGYALPAAIGGAVARPGLPTVAIAGDYGFQYTLQELGTAVELGLPLPILIWDNQRLQEIDDSMTRAQIAPNAVRVHNPDFATLAKAYGACAASPQTTKELCEDVLSALQRDRPTLIHMRAGLDE